MTESFFRRHSRHYPIRRGLSEEQIKAVKEQERQMIALGRRGDPGRCSAMGRDLLRSREELDHWTDRSGGWRLGNYLSPDVGGANRRDHRHTDRRPQKSGLSPLHWSVSS